MKRARFILVVVCLAGFASFGGALWAEEQATLAMAAGSGDVGACIACLDSGSMVDSVSLSDPFRRTPLIIASMNGHLAVVNLLIARGAEVNARDANRATALSYASEKGYEEAARALIRAHADVNARDRFGDRPLFAATRENFPQLVSVLLSAGADPFARSLYSGETAQLLAHRNGFTVIEQQLIAASKP